MQSIRIRRARDDKPIVPVQMKSLNGQWVTINMLLDSGSDLTTLSRNEANQLGLPAASDRVVRIGGILGQSDIFYIHRVEMQLECCAFFGDVAVPSEDGPTLLGRDILFSAFVVQIDQDDIVLSPRFSFCNCR